MKKNIICLILIVFCLTGCASEDQLGEFSNLIIESHREKTVDTSGLNRENESLFNEFVTEQKKEEREINLSNMLMFGGEDFETFEEDTEDVYLKDGDYYIKYRDLEFISVNDIEVASVIAGGYEVDVYKDLVPMLYKETNDGQYNYRFMGMNKNDKEAIYYYRSYSDGSMLRIIYKLDDDKIKDVNLVYDYVYSVPDEPFIDAIDNKGSLDLIIFIVVVIVLVIALVLLKKYKEKKEA